MTGSDIPLAELVAEFSATDPPKLLGYHVVVGGRAVALLTLKELELAGFSPEHEVQSFEVAETSRPARSYSGTQATECCTTNREKAERRSG